MVPAYRSTFYHHQTHSTYLREYPWARSTKLEGSHIEPNDDLLDVIRARTLNVNAKAYWAMDLARVWIREGWARWLSNQPAWFTKKWRARIPEEWFDGDDDDSAVVSMTRQEATFRRVVGRTSPWDLDARAFEAFLDEQFANSKELVATKSEVIKRGQLAYQIAGAGGVGLLERCCETGRKHPPMGSDLKCRK